MPAKRSEERNEERQEKDKEKGKDKLPDSGRFVVQAGAYTDSAKVASVRQKLTAAGLGNYTQQVTQNGKQVTRVRLGPFTSRQQMERVAAQVRALGLPVSTYSL